MISSYSKTINDKFRGRFNSILAVSDSSTSLIELPLKPISDYTKLLNRLDFVVNDRPFMNSTMSLSPGQEQRGNISEGSMQYFMIVLKGKQGPLTIKVSTIKGKVVSYTSQRTSTPSKSSYENRFTSETFKLETYSTFRDNNLYLGVKAIEDSTISVSCRFGAETSGKIQLKTVKSLVGLIKSPIPEINVKSPVKTKPVRRIKQVRPTTQEEKSRLIEKRNTHSSIVRFRRDSEYSEKMKKLQNRMHRKEIAQLAYSKAVQSLHVERRSNRFYKKWLTFIYFSLGVKAIKSTISRQRGQIQGHIFRFVSTVRIQKNFRILFLNGYSVEDKIVERARNNLLLFKFLSNPTRQMLNGNLLIKFSFKSAKDFSIKRKCVSYHTSVSKIQEAWKKYRMKIIDIFDEVSVLWDYIVLEQATQVSKKKKKDSVWNTVPLGIKNQVIGEYIDNVKNKLVADIQRGAKLVMFKYWPSDATMFELISSASKIMRKQKKKTHKR